MRIAAVPGSYDPVTAGHVDLIRRAAGLFDRVYVVAMVNADKSYLLAPQERLELMQDALGDIPGVVCEYAEGYFYQYARAREVVAIVKGVRSVADYEYEMEIADYNRRHYPRAETLLLPASPGLDNVSSRKVKEALIRGEDISGLVTEKCLKVLKDKLL